jgi:hypothetical protein
MEPNALEGSRGSAGPKDVKPKDIDGGFEFNGWYLFDTFTKTNWWVVNDTYLIAFEYPATTRPSLAT